MVGVLGPVDVVVAATDFVVGGLDSDEPHPVAMAPTSVTAPTTIGNRRPSDVITFEYTQREVPLITGRGPRFRTLKARFRREPY